MFLQDYSNFLCHIGTTGPQITHINIRLCIITLLYLEERKRYPRSNEPLIVSGNFQHFRLI